MRSTAEITAVTRPRPAKASAHPAKFVREPSEVITILLKRSTIIPPRPVAASDAADTIEPIIVVTMLIEFSIVLFSFRFIS